jgi:ATP-dependent Clp protease, protease subunit
MPKAWYTITAAAEGDKPAEISIFDAIGATWDGEGVTAKQFIADLRAIDASAITLSVNSPGGQLFDGLAISNALRQHPATVTARVMGYAASAATVVLMGADTIEAPANTFLMLHKASSGAWGNADEMRGTADVLDKIDTSMMAIYANRMGKSVEDVAAMLSDGDLWLTAQEAKDLGLIDTVLPEAKVTAKAAFDIAKLPAHVQAALRPPEPPAPPPAPARVEATLAEQIMALVDSAGLTEYQAVIALDPSVTDLSAAQKVVARVREVVTYATMVGRPEMAAPLVQARKSVADARAALAEALALADEALPIDNHLPVDPPTKPAPAAATAGGPVSFWSNKR